MRKTPVERPSACVETAVLSSDCQGRRPRSRTEPRPATCSVRWKRSRRTSLDRCDRRVWPDARGHRAGSPLISAIRSSNLTGRSWETGGHVSSPEAIEESRIWAGISQVTGDRAVELVPAAVRLVTTFSTPSRRDWRRPGPAPLHSSRAGRRCASPSTRSKPEDATAGLGRRLSPSSPPGVRSPAQAPTAPRHRVPGDINHHLHAQRY